MNIKEGDKVCLECGGVNEHKAGCSSKSDQEFEVLSVYSRTQAIEDGVLVDCTQPPFEELNRNAGIKVHVAMTREAFQAYVHPVSGKLPRGQDIKGRYWDIVWMMRIAMQRQRDSSCVLFRLHVVPNSGGVPRPVELKCVAGPDDEGDLCLTIMLPDQD